MSTSDKDYPATLEVEFLAVRVLGSTNFVVSQDHMSLQLPGSKKRAQES